MTPKKFSNKVLKWFNQHGRHDLPWQVDPTPYRVWVSEIMLQQTQVTTVTPYYLRFMERFPAVEALAAAEQDQVLHLWTGLGYYARARNLHKAAKTVCSEYSGEFPQSVEQLCELSGIGQSTAGAIAAISMGLRAPILDGNVKRVLARFHGIHGYPEQTDIKRELWQIADAATPSQRVADYTQAMMDLGATVCTRSKPSCAVCPLSADCQSLAQDLIPLIPGKKPKKTMPVKAVSMFIIQNAAGDVLLEKRPPNGIWGSLWSFPEGEEGSNEPEIGNINTGASERPAPPPLRHTFSHYHLDIQPICLRNIEKAGEVADSDRWLWYPLDHSMEVGLAAPVKKLLSELTG